MAAVRGGLGDILAGGAASVALAIFVYPLGLGLLLAIPLAVGIYAGLVLLLPARIDPRPRALAAQVAPDDEPAECADMPLPATIPEVDDAIAPVPEHIAAARRWGLTRREHEIVILLCTSHPMLTNLEVAAELFIGYRTVDNHVARILAKLGLKSRRELPAFAAKHGLLPPSTPAASTE